MPGNIYITGFMGSGKSRFGEALALRLRRPWIDMDVRFAQEHGGVSAGEFIRTQGEEPFRKEEQALLKRLARDSEFTVISTGGGVPAWPGNREILRSSGVTATLDVPLEVIEKRLSAAETASRPLWDPKDAAARRQRLEQRLPFYHDCEYRLDGTQAPGQIVEEFLTQAADWLKAAPAKSRVFRSLLQEIGRDAAEFGLFAAHDRILVGISGGEDSLMLMHLLSALQKRLPFPIELFPATIDLGYPGFDGAALQSYCTAQGWQLQLLAVPGIQKLFAEKQVGDKPCALCSRLRRGKLHGLLETLHCNKLALGQHLDDLCVSFLIALFRGGGLKTMAPNVAADGGKARLIRPLWGCRKADLHEAAQFFAFPEVKSCPYEGALEARGDRYYLTELLKQLEGRFPDLKSAMRHSLGDIRAAHLLDHRYLSTPDQDSGKL